jgi:purine-binding chemotaxis protein CheW
MSNNNEFELNEDEVSQFITFRIQNYEYGVGIGSIKEIKGWMNVTALPNTPQYVLGVINLRGTVVPIFDLKCRFGLGHSEPTKSHVILILTVGTRLMGLLVDAVTEIITIKTSEIREVPSIQANDTNDAASIFRGVVNYDKRMIVLLVADQIFDNTVDISHESLTQNLEHHGA